MTAQQIYFDKQIVGRIGYGCWQLAGAYTDNGKPNGYGTIDEAESIKAIHIALDNGINFFDTAAGYGAGASEVLLSKALKSYSGSGNLKPVICTKYADSVDGSTDNDDFSSANMVRSVEASLRRLQTDCLGAVLLHNPADNFDFSDFDTEPFERLVKQGKLQSYGVSCRSQKGVANVLASGFGSIIEAVYNPLDRRYEAHFSDDRYKNKYTFISRVPLASGFISPKTLTETRTFPENDIRVNFNEEQVNWVTESVKKLAFLQQLEGGITVSALRFQISNPYHTLTIPGMKTVGQVQDAVLAINLGPLPEDVVHAISEAVPEVFYKWR